MSPDELRAQVAAKLAIKNEQAGACPRCRGTGQVTVSRPVVTHAELADIIGVPRTAVSTFLSGKQGLLLPATLRLLEWLAEPLTPRQEDREGAGS